MGLLRISAIFLALFFTAGLALAVPGIPHQFYGTVTVNGNPAHGASIAAKINGVEVASTLSSNGTYGYYPNVFFVQDPNNTNSGKKIEFFLNSNKIAEATFANGGTSQLDLSYGTNPAVCGDGACDASEDCSSCAQDCGQCPSPPPQPPAGGGGGGSGGGGGGGSTLIVLQIDGNCISQGISLVAKSGGLPLENAVVTVTHNQKQVDSKTTGADGRLSFSFSEAGKYTFSAKRGSVYASNPVTIELKDCSAPAAGGTETPELPPVSSSAGKTCEGVNCSDSNPCTIDSCTSGSCVYSNAANGTSCAAGFCKEGACVKNTVQPTINPPSVFTGFFGLGMAGNIIAGLLALFGIFSFFTFYNSKFRKK